MKSQAKQQKNNPGDTFSSKVYTLDQYLSHTLLQSEFLKAGSGGWYEEASRTELPVPLQPSSQHGSGLSAHQEAVKEVWLEEHTARSGGG